MPTCRDMSELVTEYLERSLPISVRLGVRLHLCQCEMCRRYFDQMRRTVHLLASQPRIPPPPSVEEALLGAARGASGSVDD